MIVYSFFSIVFPVFFYLFIYVFLFFCLLQVNRRWWDYCCIALRRTALRRWETQRKSKWNKKKKVRWTTLRGERFHFAQAPNKRENKEKKKGKKKSNRFLTWSNLEKEMMGCWTRGQWNVFCDSEFIICHHETGLCLQTHGTEEKRKEKKA